MTTRPPLHAPTPSLPVADPHHLALLTPPMAELCRKVGEDALLALLGEYGGTRLYVPETVGGKVEALIGPDAAAHLVAEYGRDILTIPLCKTWRAHMLARRGLSYPAIARQLGMHWASVERILSGRVRTDPPARQMRFDV